MPMTLYDNRQHARYMSIIDCDLSGPPQYFGVAPLATAMKHYLENGRVAECATLVIVSAVTSCIAPSQGSQCPCATTGGETATSSPASAPSAKVASGPAA